MNEADFNQMLEKDGYDAAITIEMAAGEVLDTHTHDFDAAVLVLSGELTVTTADGTTTTCRAGDLFRLDNNIPHSENVGQDGVRFLVGRRQVLSP